MFPCSASPQALCSGAFEEKVLEQHEPMDSQVHRPTRAEVVAQYLESGLTRTKFCEKYGIARSTLRRWMNSVEQKPGQDKSAA